MTVTKLNPGHPVIRSINVEDYAKIVGIIIHKFKMGKVLITSKDIEDFGSQFGEGMPTIVVDGKPEGLYISVVSQKDAISLIQMEKIK